MWKKICNAFKSNKHTSPEYYLDYLWEGKWQRAKKTFANRNLAYGYGSALMENLANIISLLCMVSKVG